MVQQAVLDQSNFQVSQKCSTSAFKMRTGSAESPFCPVAGRAFVSPGGCGEVIDSEQWLSHKMGQRQQVAVLVLLRWADEERARVDIPARGERAGAWARRNAAASSCETASATWTLRPVAAAPRSAVEIPMRRGDRRSDARGSVGPAHHVYTGGRIRGRGNRTGAARAVEDGDLAQRASSGATVGGSCSHGLCGALRRCVPRTCWASPEARSRVGCAPWPWAWRPRGRRLVHSLRRRPLGQRRYETYTIKAGLIRLSNCDSKLLETGCALRSSALP